MFGETVNYEVIIITYIIAQIILKIIGRTVSFIIKQIKKGR